MAPLALSLSAALLLLVPIPEPPGAAPLPRLERQAGPWMPFVCPGQQALATGIENGSVEVWIWPHKVATRIDPSLRVGGEARRLGDHLIAFAQRPECATALYELPSGEHVAMHVFVPVEEPTAALIFEAPDLEEPAVVELPLSASLRRVWPGSSDGISPFIEVAGEEAVVLFNAVEGGPEIYAAIDATYPLRERVLPQGGTAIAVPLRPGDRVAVGFALDEGGWEGAADRASELARHHRFEIGRAGEAYREILAGFSIRTGDRRLDQAFLWSQVALARSRIRPDDAPLVVASGYGPSGVGSSPGQPWTDLGDLATIMELAAPVGIVDEVERAVDELARRDSRDGDIRRIASLLSPVDADLEDRSYRYSSPDAPAHLLRALVVAYHWTGDEGRLRRHEILIDEALAEWDPDPLLAEASTGRLALWWGAAADARALLELSESELPGLQRLAGAEDHLAQGLAGRWDGDLGWFLSADGQGVSPLTVEAVRFAARDRGRAVALVEYLRAQGLIADRGLRTLGPRLTGYQPATEGMGAIDPVVTAEVARSLRHVAPDLSRQLVGANAGLMGELCLGGAPAAVHADTGSIVGAPWNSAASAAVGGAALRAVLGLEPRADEMRLVVSPLLIDDLGVILVEGLRIAGGRLDLTFDPVEGLEAEYDGPGELTVVLRIAEGESAAEVSGYAEIPLPGR